MAVESFTDPAAHAGTTYAACGFTAAGPTAGYGGRGAAIITCATAAKTCWLRDWHRAGWRRWPPGSTPRC